MLQIKERRHCQLKTITLIGEFDRKAMTGIQAKIVSAQEIGHHHIILNFSRVTEIDPSSLNELFLWYHNLKSKKITVCVVKPSPYIRYHEDWNHLGEIISIFNSLDEVIDSEDLN